VRSLANAITGRGKTGSFLVESKLLLGSAMTKTKSILCATTASLVFVVCVQAYKTVHAKGRASAPIVNATMPKLDPKSPAAPPLTTLATNATPPSVTTAAAPTPTNEPAPAATTAPSPADTTPAWAVATPPKKKVRKPKTTTATTDAPEPEPTAAAAPAAAPAPQPEPAPAPKTTASPPKMEDDHPYGKPKMTDDNPYPK
jgi:hypothetical protein